MTSAASTSSSGSLRARLPSWVGTVIGYLPAALAPVGALGVAGLAGRGPRFLRDHPILSGGLVVGAIAGLARWQLQRLFAEAPSYRVERRIGDLEIRVYEPRIVAETTVDVDDWNAALDEGFRRLFRYISGANRSAQKLDMTVPVEGTRATAALPTAATATARREGSGYTIAFLVPAGWQLSTLPVPDDARIMLRSLPEERVAVRCYRGTYGARKTRKEQARLLDAVRAAGLEPDGEPRFAGYDPPSTLPFLRRLEAAVPLATAR